MSERVRVELPDAQPALELLSDEELLAVCDGEMDVARQEELSDLLERAQEGSLAEAKRRRLDDLIRGYRTGLVRKAQALQIAITRGLRPRLS